MILNIPLLKSPLLQRFYHDNSGLVLVQMTLIIVPFILLFLFIAELCTVLFVSVSIDLAMAEAMRYTSASAQSSLSSYRSTFIDRMSKGIQSMPLLTFDESNVTFDAKYCKNLEELADNSCSSTGAISGTVQYPVAIFSISYKHDPIFFPFPDTILKNSMNRTGIYVMENLRFRK